MPTGYAPARDPCSTALAVEATPSGIVTPPSAMCAVTSRLTEGSLTKLYPVPGPVSRR